MAQREPYLTNRDFGGNALLADVGTTEDAGTSTKVSRADHRHAHGAGKNADDHHAESHAHDGVDGSGTVAHGDLTGTGTDDHHPQVHGSDDHSIDYAAALSGIRTLTGPTTYALADTDGVVICDAAAGDITITLPAITATVDPPAAGSAGKVYSFYRKDSSDNDVIFDPTGSDVVLGDVFLPGLGQRVILVADAAPTPKAWAPLTPGRGPLTVTKPSDTSRASTTTVTDDPHLSFPVESGGIYLVQGIVFYDAIDAADLKSTIAAPGGSTGGWSPTGVAGNSGFNQVSTTANALVALGTTRSHGGGGAGTFAAMQFAAIIVAGAAGRVSFQWAQDASNATATILKAGSALWYQRVNT